MTQRDDDIYSHDTEWAPQVGATPAFRPILEELGIDPDTVVMGPVVLVPPGPDLVWLWYYVTTERYDRKGWPKTGTPKDAAHPSLYAMSARFASRCRRGGLPARGEGQRIALDMVDRGGVWEWRDEEIELHHPGYLDMKRVMDDRLSVTR